MTTIDFTGWTKNVDDPKEHFLTLDGYPDVEITTAKAITGLPFFAMVGHFYEEGFRDLGSAMQWAKQLAEERAIIIGPDPLPVFTPPPPEDETLERDREFLYSRGLTKL